MGGISNYFDGETGIVTKVDWKRKDSLLFIIHLKDNPHREYAMDYNSDIRIDAAIRPGDHVVYKQLDAYSGFWFKQGEERQLKEIFNIRHDIRKEKYKKLFLPMTLAIELLMISVLSAFFIIAFYFFRYKPGEAFDRMTAMTFIAIYLSLTISGLFHTIMKFPTIGDVRDRGLGIIWDMIKFLIMEIVYVVLGTLAVLVVGGIILAIGLAIVAPEIKKSIDVFFKQNNNFLYFVIAGFSIWAIINLFSLFRMRYSPEGDNRSIPPH